MKHQREDIMKTLLPADMLQSIENRPEIVLELVSRILAKKVSDIIQENFIFLVQNNLGEVVTLEDLFKQVVFRLVDQGDQAKLEQITVASCH